MKKVMLMIVLCLTVTINFAQEESKGKIHGYMFGDYFYNLSRDANASSISNAVDKGEKDINGFQFRRIYFGYDYSINKEFSTRFRVEADQKENTSGGKIGLFVKDAYLKWKNIIDGSDLIVGFSPTPAFGVSEDYWGYRSLEKTIMDLRKIASSRDLGVAVKGKLSDNGNIKYWLMAANGEGNKPETNKQKSIYGHLELEPVKNLTFTLYGDYRAGEDITNPKSTQSFSNNTITTALFAGYQEPGKFSLGLETFYQINQNEIFQSAEAEDQKAMGISLFGSADVSDKFSIQPELLYSAQGAKYEDEVLKETIKLDYLNLPIMAKFYVADGFSLEAGPQVGFLLSAKGKVEAGGESIEADIKELFKGIDFGFNFGVGYKLPSGINFGARYNLGLSNIIEPDSEFNVGDVKNQNGVIQLSLGYFF